MAPAMSAPGTLQRVSGTQERRVLALVAHVMGLLDLEELCQGLIEAFHEVIPSTWSP